MDDREHQLKIATDMDVAHHWRLLIMAAELKVVEAEKELLAIRLRQAGEGDTDNG